MEADPATWPTSQIQTSVSLHLMGNTCEGNLTYTNHNPPTLF